MNFDKDALEAEGKDVFNRVIDFIHNHPKTTAIIVIVVVLGVLLV